MKQAIFHLHALSALHVGTGQGVGTVDLPIARAKATNLPLVPGSSIKGVLRDSLPLSEADLKVLFGPESTANTDAHAGALAVGDAHLLLLPVRSFAGTMAYATCPFILRQYARDLALKTKIPTVSDTKAAVIATSKLTIKAKIILEDLDLDVQTDGDIAKWAEHIGQQLFADDDTWQKHLSERFVILSDSTFAFLADTATEIRMRIRIDPDTRTVKTGALWSEENLPAESVLWGIMGVSPSRVKTDPRRAEDLAKLLPSTEQTIQIGGKHTVGRGLCRFMAR